MKIINIIKKIIEYIKKNLYFISFIVFLLFIILYNKCIFMNNYIIKIDKWNGRLGNNIIQLINMIQIALYYNYEINIPAHSFFKYNNQKKILNISNKLITNNYNFFYKNKIDNIDTKLFDCNIIKTKNILKNMFTIKQNSNFKKNKMIIHIRSGDIFTNCIHKDYINPPFYYYKKIIDENNCENIIIISEDKNNPTIDKLLHNYSNIIFKQQKLKEDIKLLLESEIVVMSIGSFVPSLLILSDNVKKLYKPSYQSLEMYNNFFYNIEIINVDLDEYRSKQYPWKNTKEQNDLLLNYTK